MREKAYRLSGILTDFIVTIKLIGQRYKTDAIRFSRAGIKFTTAMGEPLRPFSFTLLNHHQNPDSSGSAHGYGWVFTLSHLYTAAE